jgi:protein O-GlcNAc transferase
MNRKQRRTEAKLGQRTVPLPTVTALFAKAIGCHQSGRIAEAEALYLQILANDPDNVETHSNLGMIFRDRGAFPEAIACYRKTLALRPQHAPAHVNLGIVFADQGDLAESIKCYSRALAYDPDLASAYNSLGNALRDQGRLDESVVSYRRSLALMPGYAEGHSNLGNVFTDLGELENAKRCYERAVALNPEFARARSNLLVCQHYDGRISNAELLAEARRFGAHFDSPASARKHLNDRSPARRLRIGYLSGDFRQHPVGFLLARVLETHDRGAVEIFCYAHQPHADEMTRRLRASSDHWRDILGVSDADAAALILRDRIDILVDLAGHTGNNRLLIFTLRPAPVQVSWLGYFDTTGLGAIDYILMDESSVPPGEERWFSESVVRLPHGRFCYAPPEYAPDPASPPALRRGYVTFGSFNNLTKVGPDVVGLWADVLRATPTSRLLVKWKSLDGETARRRLLDALISAGVAAERVELRGGSVHQAMLAQYADVDIALDTFPFGGGLTSCEALWMGVPVVTLPGDRPASRQTIGLLAHVGLEDCVAGSPIDYVRRATALAADTARLRDRRHAQRSRMAASPLCDGALFTPTLEAAFRQMWARWCASPTAPLNPTQ